MASLVVHAALVFGISVQAAGSGVPQMLRARLVPVAAPDALRASAPTQSLERSPVKTSAVQPEAVPETSREADSGAAIESLAGARDAILSSDRTVYYLPQDVDVRATVIGLQTTLASEKELLLGRLARVKLRLYINDRGTVDTFDVLESEGLTDSVSIDDVKDFRFNAAQKRGRAVASQKVVELTFAR